MQQEFDNILEDRIGYGRYQNLIIILIYLNRISEGYTIDGMQIIIPIVKSEFDMSQSTLKTITSLYYLGMMIGAPLGGMLSDKLGRRFAFFYSMLQTMTIQISFYFVNDVHSFGMVRFLSGFAFSFMLSIPSTIAAEISTIKLRGKIQLIINIFITLGRVLAAASTFQFLNRDLKSGNWKLMLLSPIVLNVMSTLGMLLLLEESPRYLIANGQIQKAIKVINKMIVFNNPNYNVRLVSQEEQRKIKQDYMTIYKNKPKGNIKQLYSKRFMKTSIILNCQWALLNFIYYATLQLIPYILANQQQSNSPQMSLLINACSEVPTIFLNIMMIDNKHLGRRNSLILLNMMTCLLHLANIFYINDILLFFTRFFMKSSFAMLFTLTVESYPTLIRSIGFSMSSSFGRIGSFSMPFIVFYIYHLNDSYPFVLLTIMSLVMALLMLVLDGDSSGTALDAVSQQQIVNKQISSSISLDENGTHQAMLFKAQLTKL